MSFGSPVFRIDVRSVRLPTAAAASSDRQPGRTGRPVAWFTSTTPLRSGWAWGQDRLAGGVAVADVRLGDGHIAMFGPQITFRGQSHGTFKFLFNGIFYGKALLLPRVPAPVRLAQP